MSLTVQPPPPSLAQDSFVIDAIHKRLSSKSRFFPKLRLRTNKKESPLQLPNINVSVPDCASIKLDNLAIEEQHDETKDRYEWAIVYENQRGQVALRPLVSFRLNWVPQHDSFLYPLLFSPVPLTE